MKSSVRPHLPFSAVVGQDLAKTALLLAAVEPRLGGVLLRGDKGSAKTTLARGLADLLPGDAPFVELPLGATEDRVLGALDVAALLGDGAHAFRPGLLAAAHGGVLYVDEINLLADHLVDALLDVAVSGVNRVERDGLSHTHPARFVLVGSMNPEEGELRPQLLDRFGLACDVRSSLEPAERSEIVRRQLAFDATAVHDDAFTAADRELAARLGAARPAALGDTVIETATRLALAVGAEGLRADLSLCRAAAALAGWEGRAEADEGDLARVAPLVLGHRRRRNPFDRPGISDEELADALDRANEPPSTPPTGPGDEPEEGSPADPDAPTSSAAPPPGAGGSPSPPDVLSASGDLTAPPLSAPRPPQGRSSTAASGRSTTATSTAGRFLRPAEHDDHNGGPVAATATAVAYATRRAGDSTAVPERSDLRSAVHEQRIGALVVLAVDASGSMHAERRLGAAKAVAFDLLADAYRRRDRVAVVAFRGDDADVVLRPTGSVEIARARLAELPSGGTTPLAAGLDAVTALLRSASRAPGGAPSASCAVLFTDGRATAGGDDPLAAADGAAAALARTGAACLVVDSETGATRLGLARRLAEQLAADYVHLDELAGDAAGEGVSDTVRRTLNRARP